VAVLDGSAGSPARRRPDSEADATGRRPRGGRHVAASGTAAAADPGPPRPHPLFLSGSIHIHPSIKCGAIFFFFSGQKFHRSIRRTATAPASGDHLPAAAVMRSRSSTDRLEALSIEIERKLQKVPARPLPNPRAGCSLRCCDFVRCRFSCPGLLGVLNFPAICARRGRLRPNGSRATSFRGSTRIHGRWRGDKG